MAMSKIDSFMKKNNFVFIGDTTYSLLLYMLYANEDMLANTTFYVGKNLMPCALPNKVVMPELSSVKSASLTRCRIKCLKYRHRLKHSIIFAQDHLYFSPALIDNLKYTVLEDCPNFFTVLHSRVPKQPPFEPSLGAYWQNFKFGRIYQRYGGYNPWCINRIVTTKSDKQLFDTLNLNSEEVELEGLWKNASENKRNYIMEVFLLHDTKNLTKRRVVIFSQPLKEDAGLSVNEIVSIYKPYIEHYGEKNILVKVHPRDRFDYKKLFTNIETLQTKAPQQLLTLMGLTFDVAITVCSSAVSSMGQGCKVIWLGAEIDDRIVKAYGHVKKPINC